MVYRVFSVILWLVALAAVGCSPSSSTIGSQASRQLSQSVVTENILQADWRVLRSGSKHLESTTAALQRLANEAPWRKNGFFNAEQQDQVEDLLFRYLACRHALWQLANHFRDSDTRYPDEEAKAKNAVIGFDAGFRLILSDALLVTAFRGDPVAIAKLNEAFYRSKIPANTYEHLRLGVTNEDQLRALRDSFLLYTQELAEPSSSLARVVKNGPEYGDLVETTQSIASQADAVIHKLIATESPVLPTLDNRLRHTRVAQLLSESERTTDDLLDVARAHLFKGVSRIKNPDAHLIKFSADQKRQVNDALQPGDIILT